MTRKIGKKASIRFRYIPQLSGEASCKCENFLAVFFSQDSTDWSFSKGLFDYLSVLHCDDSRHPSFRLRDLFLQGQS